MAKRAHLDDSLFWFGGDSLFLVRAIFRKLPAMLQPCCPCINPTLLSLPSVFLYLRARQLLTSHTELPAQALEKELKQEGTLIKVPMSARHTAQIDLGM